MRHPAQRFRSSLSAINPAAIKHSGPALLKARLGRVPVIALLAVALVLVGAGTTAVWASGNKSVTLSVDGKSRTVRTRSDDVRGLLSDAKIRLGKHDVVAPSLGSAIDDHADVAVRYGKPVRVNLDGDTDTVWTTAGTVGARHRRPGPALLRCGVLREP